MAKQKTQRLRVNNMGIQDIIALISCILAAMSVCLSSITIAITKKIAMHQKQREENHYLLEAIVQPYNKIEVDILMADTSEIDESFNKVEFDKEVLSSICIAKSYAYSIRNTQLFDYLDQLITGECEENIGGFIEEYFLKRNDLIIQYRERLLKREEVATILHDSFLEKSRLLRNATVDKIKKII